MSEFLRTAQIIKENRLAQYDFLAEFIISIAIETVNSHDSEWISIDQESGYYTFPINSPFYLDGVEMPINEAAVFGTSLVRLYFLTEDAKYLRRAKSMWNRWLESMFWDQFGYIYYAYVLGDWQQGWDGESTPSQNSPVVEPEIRPETFHKAGLTIEFLLQLQKATGSPIVTQILDEFYRVMKSVLHSTERIESSEFPRYLGFYFPVDSVHWSPAHYAGWIQLMSGETAWNDSLLLNYAAGLRPSYALLSAQIYGAGLLSRIGDDVQKETVTVKPILEQVVDESCTIKLSSNAIGIIKFQHSSPKNNKLYLISDNGAKIRLKINLERGYFEGKIFILKDQCVKLTWNDSGQYSRPQTDAENKVEMTFYSVKSG